ncbi:hypothetical protein WG66_002715, partial [Moniliophthora roreri]
MAACFPYRALYGLLGLVLNLVRLPILRYRYARDGCEGKDNQPVSLTRSHDLRPESFKKAS